MKMKKHKLLDGSETTEGELALDFIRVCGLSKQFDLFKTAITEKEE